jgi:hypothetical protein
MSAIWSMSKALQIPLDKKLTKLSDAPYTISYVIRKRQQIDSFNELPKEKRPPDDIIWDGNADDLDEWLDKVFNRKDGGEETTILITDIED